MWNPFSNKPDPNSSSGLTIEDVKQAHIEASMEEEMLNGEK